MRAALGLTAAAIALAPGLAAAEDLDLRVEMQIRSDGTVAVTEERTFSTQPSQHMFYLEYSGRRITMSDASVSEGGRPYREIGQADERTPGTFLFDPVVGRISIFFEPGEPSRSVTFGYTIEGAIVRYDDVAEMEWPFVGVGAARARSVVELPPGARAGEVRAWPHGAFTGRVTDPTRVVWERTTGTHLVDGRLVFPERLVPGLRTVGGLRLSQVLALEEAPARVLEPKTYSEGVDRAAPVAAAVALAGLAAIALLARAARAPEPVPPAVVASVVRFGDVRATDLVATIADLARRGYVEAAEREGGTAPRFALAVSDDRWDELQPYERALLVMLRTAAEVDARDDVSLRQWAEGAPEMVRSRVRGFAHMANEHARRLGLREPARWAGGTALLLLVVTGMAVAVGGLALDARDWAVLAVLGSIAIGAAGFAAPRGGGLWLSLAGGALVAGGAVLSDRLPDGAFLAAMLVAAAGAAAPMLRMAAYARRTGRARFLAMRPSLGGGTGVPPEPLAIVLGAPLEGAARRFVASLEAALTPRRVEQVTFWSAPRRPAET